jgi:hypothetical protein
MLTGEQTNCIYEALINGYNHASLEMMTKIALNQDLDLIAGGRNFSEVVFSLVRWADRTGNLCQLIRGAIENNPNNHQLQALAVKARGWEEQSKTLSQRGSQGINATTSVTGLNPDEWLSSKKSRRKWQKLISFLTDDPT